MKKILVTGSNGFVGRNTVVALKETNKYEILTIDRSNSEEELKELAHKCSLNTGGHKGSAKVLYEADMLAIYEMAK